MKKLVIILIVTCLCSVSFAQQALWGAGDITSPAVNADNSATFSILAPEAQKIEVTGDFLPPQKMQTPMGEMDAPGSAALTKDDKGIWKFTSAPLAPELYSYTFLIDGVKVCDPNNPYMIRDVASVTSIFIIGGDRADLYKVNDLPHGTVAKLWYHSNVLKMDRRLTIYTPAGYETSKETYPVLYLLHGAGGDENAWSELGRTTQILDNLIVQSPRFKKYPFSNKPDLKAHAEVTRNSAAEGMVLLENNSALPFAQNIKTVAAYGITSYDFIAGGTGSGDVNEAYTVSLKEGLTNAGYTLNAELAAQYENHIAAENEKNKPDPNNKFAMFLPKIRAAEFVPAAKELAKAAAESDVALITIGRTSGEFSDRTLADFSLSAAEQQLLKNVTTAYHAAKKQVVVVLNIGGVIETASWKTLPDAVLLAWQAGQEGGNSVADVLKGTVNPSGKLPMTFPVKYMDAASSANFPYDYFYFNRFIFCLS